MIVIRTGATGGRASRVAEVRANRLRCAAARQRVVGRECLRSRGRWCDSRDQYPRWTAGIGSVVKVEMVGGERAISPDRCTDLYGFARRQSAAVGGLNGEAVVGFVGVERSRRAVGAGAVDGVGLIRLVASRERVATEKQGRTGIAADADAGAGRSLEGCVVSRRLQSG